MIDKIVFIGNTGAGSIPEASPFYKNCEDCPSLMWIPSVASAQTVRLQSRYSSLDVRAAVSDVEL